VVDGFLEGKSDCNLSEDRVLQGAEHPVIIRIDTRGIDGTAECVLSFHSYSFSLGSSIGSSFFFKADSFDLGSSSGSSFFFKADSFGLCESKLFGQYFGHSFLFGESGNFFFSEPNLFCCIGCLLDNTESQGFNCISFGFGLGAIGVEPGPEHVGHGLCALGQNLVLVCVFPKVHCLGNSKEAECCKSLFHLLQ
jgi:hypothetical protein